jgi:hypothetical protein
MEVWGNAIKVGLYKLDRTQFVRKKIVVSYSMPPWELSIGPPR